MPFMGEFIALATVLCWTCSIQFFEAASKRVGAVPVNIIRLFVALLCFGLFLFVRDGALLPHDFSGHAWFYLSLSGVVGFFIGDIFLFMALVELGPRVTMLIQSLAAPTAAVIGWLLLGEHYALYQWTGMAITLAGVGVVILERSKKLSPVMGLTVRRVSYKGVLFGFVAMFGQAGGLLMSKVGMQTESGYLDAFAATEIRALAAFVCFVLYFTVTGKWRAVGTALSDKRAVVYTSIGAAIGPFVGVSLSLMALHYLSAGVASTFFSLIPICIIPFSVYLHKEHVSLRAISGAVTAVFGVYLLML